MPRHNDLIRSSGDLLVLSVLDEQPRYGYSISKLIAARSDGQIRMSPGVLYPLLHQMEKQGLLLTSWETVQGERNDDESGGRRRKWYRLSAKGRRRLAARIAAHRAYQQLIESFLPTSSQEEGRS